MPLNEIDITKGPIQSVSRAVAILRCFFDSAELGLQEISEQVGLHKSTTSTLVTTLKNERLLEQNPQTNKYRLGMTAFLLGTNSNINLSAIAQPFLMELSGKYRETVNLAAPIGSDIIYLNKIDSEHSMRTCTRVGHQLPFYCTANGKIIFSYYGEQELRMIIQNIDLKKFTSKTISDSQVLEQELREAKKKGYACDSEELEIGLCCYAAPIFDYTHYPAAAISISGPSFRMGYPIREEMIIDLKSSAQKITDILIRSKYIASRNTQ